MTVMTQSRIRTGASAHFNKKQFRRSPPPTLWIIGLLGLIVLSYCSLNVNGFPSIVKRIGKWDWSPIVPARDHGLDPDVGDNTDDNAGMHSLLDEGNTNQEDSLGNKDGYVRRPRAAAYVRTDKNSIKHYERIPVSKAQLRHRDSGSPPPPDESEDEFESLEANREAFLEILNDHAKHPHRRRSFKHHSNKMQLKYDFETQRYSITEKESDEW